MCASSLVLLSALRISHLRLLAFHQHCSEHYTCTGAVIKFCLFPLQRKCKTGAACECLKVPCPTPALTVNSLHTVSYRFPLSLFKGRQYSFYSHSIHPPFPHATRSARMLHWSFSYFAIQLTRQYMEDTPHVLSIPIVSAQAYIWDVILHTQTQQEVWEFCWNSERFRIISWPIILINCRTTETMLMCHKNLLLLGMICRQMCFSLLSFCLPLYPAEAQHASVFEKLLINLRVEMMTLVLGISDLDWKNRL